MSEFKQLSDGIWVSQQITLDDVAEAAARGITMIVNNRPEGESPDQTAGAAIEEAARAAGMGYVAIPITPGHFGDEEVEAMGSALESATGPVLAYCRTGTRSTLLWSLLQAKRGADLGAINAAANGAGYDLAPIGKLMAWYASALED